MKSLKYVLLVFCILSTLGCYEVNEEISINDDGSGVYNTKMDMSQLIDMMQTFAGEEKMSEQGMDRAIDTVINFQNIVDSAKEMTAEQKELMKDAKMHMQMNIKEKLFKIDINIPYKNYASLEKLLAGGGATGSAMSEVMKDVFSEKKTDDQVQALPADSSAGEIKEEVSPGMNDFTNFYDVTVKKGTISRKVNQEKWKALTDKPEMQQMKQLSSSGMEILYTTTIKLPRPVKKSDNAMFKISDGGKTITMKYNMLEMLDNPDKFSYTIEY
jgi:hypothetical protein